MTISASLHTFLLDEALAFRSVTAGAVEGDFLSEPLSLGLLTPFWATDERGVARKLRVVVGIRDLPEDAANTVTFEVIASANKNLSDPTVVASVAISDVPTGTQQFELSVPVDALPAGSAWLALRTRALGGDTAFITITDFLEPGDGFTLNNGLEAGDEVELDVEAGTYETGSIAFSGTATADDAVTVDDGVHPPVTFTFGAGAGLVAPGASAAASATNLAAAIGASDLYVDVSDDTSGTLTITNLGTFTSGALTEDVDDGSVITVTDFTGGADGVMTGDMYAARGVTEPDVFVEAVAEYINANGGDTFSAVRDGSVVAVINADADDTSIGEATEGTDTNDAIAITDFALVSAAMSFWSYVRNG
jgi:hypothetical protein